MIRVQREDFDLGAEVAALTRGNHEIGGLAVFVGLVRDRVGEENLGAMTLEHYPGMTEKALARIEEEANRRWPLEASLVIHRVGRLEPGEQIVLVAAASRGRPEVRTPGRWLVRRRSRIAGGLRFAGESDKHGHGWKWWVDKC